MIASLGMSIHGCLMQPTVADVSPPASASPIPDGTRVGIISTAAAESLEISAEETSAAIVSPIDTSDVPVGDGCELVPITTESITWMQWSASGTSLFYQLDGDPDYWEFRFDSASSRLVSEDWADSAISDPGKIQYALHAGTTGNEWQASPTGEKIVYAETELIGLPTPSDGEGTGPTAVRANICILTESALESECVGSVDGLVDGFIWFPDEGRFLVITGGRLWGSAYVWLADLDRHTLEPLLQVKSGENEAVFEGLSPEGSALLYSKGMQLLLLDLASGVERQLAVLTDHGRAYYWFLSENRLLMVDDFEGNLEFQVQVLDLTSDTLCRLPELHLRIHSIDISPNREYLIIQWEDTRELFLYHLCGPCF